MQTLDQGLIDLYRRGLISLEDVLYRCRDPEVARKTLINFEASLVSAFKGPTGL